MRQLSTGLKLRALGHRTTEVSGYGVSTRQQRALLNIGPIDAICRGVDGQASLEPVRLDAQLVALDRIRLYGCASQRRAIETWRQRHSPESRSKAFGILRIQQMI